MTMTWLNSLTAMAVRSPSPKRVMPAQMMALLTYHLLKDGAAGAKQILAESPAKMTLEEYRAYVESLQN